MDWEIMIKYGIIEKIPTAKFYQLKANNKLGVTNLFLFYE